MITFKYSILTKFTNKYFEKNVFLTNLLKYFWKNNFKPKHSMRFTQGTILLSYTFFWEPFPKRYFGI